MKIIFFETPDEDKKVLEGLFAGVNSTAGVEKLDVTFYREKLTAENVATTAEGADVISVFINSEIKSEIIDALLSPTVAPNLKLITTRSTGFDHIDVEYAKSKGIAVATVPAYGSRTVAEFAFALILALSRKIFPAYHHLRNDDSFDLSNLMGFDLNGKTIGVIGTGKIGKNSAKIAKGFNMSILAFDLFPDQAFATEVGAKYADLPTLLSTADVVTIHAPYTTETHHLINKENIKLMKRGALLVNTARGEIVDTDALVWALDQNILAGVGLDVLEGERFMKEELELLARNDAGDTDEKQAKETRDTFKMILESNALIHDPRVIATPHMAFFSKEAVEDILKTTVDNITTFIAGKGQNLLK
jgi:D-lactate dehydrogenase